MECIMAHMLKAVGTDENKLLLDSDNLIFLKLGFFSGYFTIKIKRKICD